MSSWCAHGDCAARCPGTSRYRHVVTRLSWPALPRHTRGSDRRRSWHVVGVLALALVGSGCTAVPTTPPATSSSRSAETTSRGLRDLGPDPGPEAYRTLDLCRVVDLPSLQAQFTASGGAGAVSLDVAGPGECYFRLAQAGAGVRLTFAPPRSLLEEDVRSTNPGTYDVEVSPTGTTLVAPFEAYSFLLSPRGYLLRADIGNDTADGRRLLRSLGPVALAGLAKALPSLSLPSTSLAAKDICAALRAAGTVQALGVSEPLHESVDGRSCYNDQFWVAFVDWPTFGPSTYHSAVAIAGSVAEYLPSSCQLLIPLQAAPAGAAWEHESLHVGFRGTRRRCSDVPGLLEPLVVSLRG